MPVLLKQERNEVYSSVDVEALVNEVRERLCLKQREKYCSNRRSAPYYVAKPHSTTKDQCLRKPYSSPDSCFYKDHSKQKLKKSCCGQKKASKDNADFEDPHVLLQKLIAEQSLIQEAVRRLQTAKPASTSTSTCSRKNFFPFVDEDSCDQFSNQTPSYSESEDDSASQHSIDL